MLQNTQPIIDGILVTDPPRTIDAPTTAQIKQAIMDDLGYDDPTADSIASDLTTLLETQERNPQL